MPDSFSQRHGLAGPPPGTLLRTEAPVRFRMWLTNLHSAHIGVDIEDMRRVVCEVLQVWPDPQILPYYDYRRHLETCEWFCLYEVIEELHKLVDKRQRSHFSSLSKFVGEVNNAFVANNIGWKLSNGKVVTRGDEEFENTLNTAIEVLAADKKPTAAQHLRRAIDALSSKPHPNTSGAVAHSTSAVECVLGEITGQAEALGDYLNKYPKLLPPAIKKGISGVYGYACEEGARHGKEGIEPGLEEAEFVLATCAAVCTLLTKKHRKRAS